AILRLFALVAKEDEVTHHERDQIKTFLQEHVSFSAVDTYLAVFDEFSRNLTPKTITLTADTKPITELCNEVNTDLTQKQKVVILLELISIIHADGNISDRERELLNIIGENFKINRSEIDAIMKFVLGAEPAQLDHPQVMIVDAADDNAYANAQHIRRNHLKGFVAILYVQQAEFYFIKYLGNSDLYLNGV